MMRFLRFGAVVATAAFVGCGLAGCAADDDYRTPTVTPGILTDSEAARLAELHLNDVAPQASPRDVVSIEPTHEGRGRLVGFHTYFDETQRPPKQSRLVEVDHDGDVRELTLKD